MMGIINSLFILITLTSITGTAAYGIWMALLSVAEKKSQFLWISYAGKMVALFYLLPALYGYYFLKIYSLPLIKGPNMEVSFYEQGSIVDNTITIKRIIYAAFIVWIIGLISKTIHMYVENKQVKSICAKSEDVDEETFYILERIKSQLGIKKQVQIYYNSEIVVPFVNGIFEPAIYIPKWFYTEREMEIIISHELFHVKNHDLLWKRVLMWIRLFHWFNPSADSLAKHIVSIEETCCDRDICYNSGIAGYEEYFDIILDNIEKGQAKNMPFTMCLHGDMEEISTRIIRMKNYIVKSRYKRLTALLLTMILVSASALTSVAAGSFVEKTYISTIEATEDVREEFDDESINHVTLRVPMHSRITVSSLYASRGQEIHVTVVQSEDNSEVGFGIVNEKLEGRGVLTYATRSHNFTVYKSDEYGIYVENRNDDSIEIELYYTIES